MSTDIATVRHFARELAGELRTKGADAVRGVYLHGSAVLGDWNPKASDVDVLIVVQDRPAQAVGERLADTLSHVRGCPGVGLEASIVEVAAAAEPREPWPYVVHVTTAADDPKTVWDTQHRGDRDLILHYAVTLQCGWTAHGPAPGAVFGPIPPGVVLDQLVVELRWAIEHTNESYAVLNTCRALRYRDERVLCSKTEGGYWAQTRGVQPTLVRRALEARRRGTRRPVTPEVAEWVLGVAGDLSTGN